MRKMRGIIFFLTLIFSMNVFADNVFNLTSNGISENGVARTENTLDVGSIASISYNLSANNPSYGLTLKNNMALKAGGADFVFDSNVNYGFAPNDSASSVVSMSTNPKYTTYIGEETKVDYTLELTYKNYLGKGYTDFINIFPKASMDIEGVTIDSKLGARVYLKSASGKYRVDGEFELGAGKSLTDKIYAGIGNYTLFVQDNEEVYYVEQKTTVSVITVGTDTTITTTTKEVITLDPKVKYLVSVDDACDTGMEMLYQYIWMSIYSKDNIVLSALVGNTNFYVISSPEEIYGSAYISMTYTQKFTEYVDEVGANLKYTEDYRKGITSNYLKIYLKKSF